MLYRVYIYGKSEKINISLPLTYEKLVNAISVMEQFGIPPEQQQLLVNNVQLTADTNLDKCKLTMYPIDVKKLTNINVVIGKISFSTSFYFGYKCSVLCSFILDIISSYNFEIPQFDYCLDIDGKSVDMDCTVEESGAVENSTVTLLSKSGESLDEYFHLDDEEGEEEETVNKQNEEPVLNEENEDLPKEAPVEEKPTEEKPTEEKPAEETPADKDLVTVHRRNGKDNKKVTTPSTSINQQLEKPTELPENVQALLSILRSSDKEEEEKSKAVNEIEGILLNCQSNLFDNGVQLSVYDNMITKINYENQMLRDMYNSINPQAPMTKEYEDRMKGSWQRAIRTEDDSIAVLPDDIDELKKLVNEKYATALMNERRYEKEHKRCKKWKLVAQSLGVNDENVDSYVNEFHGIMEHRDHLKDENLDLKGQIRQLNSEIDSRDDEIRRLMETVNSRDTTIQELVSKIEQYDVLLKEGGQAVKENENTAVVNEDMEEEKKKMEEEKKKMEKERKEFEDEKNGFEEVTLKMDEEYRKMEQSMKEIEEQQQRLAEQKGEIEKERRELEEEKQKQGKEDQSQIEEKDKRINELEATINELQEKMNSLSSTQQEELAQQSELLTTENNELKKQLSSMNEENEKQMNEETEVIQQLTQILEMMNNGLKAKKERMKSL